MACNPADEAHLAELREDLAAVRVAIRALLTGAQSYTLNTGQTQQTVTKANLASLVAFRRDLMGEIAQLEASCTGGSSIRVIPGF
jgi:hypothetical protein